MCYLFSVLRFNFEVVKTDRYICNDTLPAKISIDGCSPPYSNGRIDFGIVSYNDSIPDV